MVELVQIKVYLPRNPEKVTTNPYDVISDEELAELRKNPNSFIHVILPEGEGDEKYENARLALERLVSSGVLVEDHGLFLYEQSRPGFRQRGIVGGFSLEDYGNGKIKRHEKTRERPLQDRIRHIQATRAQTGLVWLMMKSNPGIKEILDQVQRGPPILDFEKYGWRNRVWKIPEPLVPEIRDLVSREDLYIADGHHRIAAAYEYMRKMHGEGKKEGPWNYVMAYLANDDEVRILPYNRVIRKLPMPFEEFLEKVKQSFDVVEGDPEPRKHEICMFNGNWYKLIPKEIPAGPVESLDVAILQSKVLGPILGITDPRRDPNIFFVGGEMTKQDLERYVTEKGNALVFSLYPTSVKEVEAVADAGLDMPPKSTWFDPKLLSGLFVHPLEG